MLAEPLSASMEDYIETILQLIQEKKVARAKDISAQMQVRKSSVTSALKTLSERGMINYSPYDFITLTPEGQTIAEEVWRRHKALKTFFIKVMAIDPETAEEGACQMEHAIPLTILDRFIKFVEFVDLCPRGGMRWVEDFGYYCRHGHPQQSCERCMTLTLEEIRLPEPSRHLEKTCLLSELKLGQKAQVKAVSGKGEIQKRLMDMGLTTGALVSLIRVEPLRNRLEVRVRGRHLSIRKAEAALIHVIPLEAEK
jgi:DtxR family transcriptional regulator, Mn-dependent transcriptional regulator